MGIQIITTGEGRLLPEEIQTLREMVNRGSPLLLAPDAARNMLDTAEREWLRPLREEYMSETATSAAEAIRAIRERNARIADLERERDEYKSALELIGMLQNDAPAALARCRGIAGAVLKKWSDDSR